MKNYDNTGFDLFSRENLSRSGKLTAEENRDLIKDYQNTGDKVTKEYIIMQNLKIVKYVALNFTNMTDWDDLLQIGVIALDKAIDTFDTEKEIKFSTYACNCIRFAYTKFYRDSKADIRRINSELTSLDATLENKNEETELDYYGILVSGDNVEEEVYNKIRTKEILDELKIYLTEKRYNYFVDYYGIDGKTPIKQCQIGDKYGVNWRTISATLRDARNVLKKYY